MAEHGVGDSYVEHLEANRSLRGFSQQYNSEGLFKRIHAPSSATLGGFEVGDQTASNYGGIYWNTDRGSIGFGFQERNVRDMRMEVDASELRIKASNATRHNLKFVEAAADETASQATDSWAIAHRPDLTPKRLQFIDIIAAPDEVMMEMVTGETGPRIPSGGLGIICKESTSLSVAAVAAGATIDCNGNGVGGKFDVDANAVGTIEITGTAGTKSYDVYQFNVSSATASDAALFRITAVGSSGFTLTISAATTSACTVYWSLTRGYSLIEAT